MIRQRAYICNYISDNLSWDCPKALYATTSDANFGKPFQDRGGGIVKK